MENSLKEAVMLQLTLGWFRDNSVQGTTGSSGDYLPPPCSKEDCRWLFTGFLPAISKKAQKGIVRTFRVWNIQRLTNLSAEDIAERINPQLRGWINYYGKFYPSEMNRLWRILDWRLVKWVRCRYKQYRWHRSRASEVLERIRQQNETLFAHWKFMIR